MFPDLRNISNVSEVDRLSIVTSGRITIGSLHRLWYLKDINIQNSGFNLSLTESIQNDFLMLLVDFMSRKMLFTVFKYLFSFQRYSSF